MSNSGGKSFILAGTAAAVTIIYLWRRVLKAEADSQHARLEAAEIADQTSTTSLPPMPLLPISSPQTIQFCK